MTTIIQVKDIWGKIHWIDKDQLAKKSIEFAEKVFGDYTTLKTYRKNGKEKGTSSFYKIKAQSI